MTTGPRPKTTCPLCGRQAVLKQSGEVGFHKCKPATIEAEDDDLGHECGHPAVDGKCPSCPEAVCEKHRGTYTVTCGPACKQAERKVD